MTIWNVRVPVVELVEADTADEALAAVGRMLHEQGWEVYDDTPDAGGPHAFESEPLTLGTEYLDAKSRTIKRLIPRYELGVCADCGQPVMRRADGSGEHQKAWGIALKGGQLYGDTNCRARMDEPGDDAVPHRNIIVRGST